VRELNEVSVAVLLKHVIESRDFSSTTKYNKNNSNEEFGHI